MNAGLIFLSFAQEVFSVFFNQVGVAHANIGVVVVERDFGLRPEDNPPVRGVGFYSATQPHRVAVLVGNRAPPRMLANKTPAVVVEPVQVFAVRALPDKIRGARVFHQASVGIPAVLRSRPGVPAVAAVRFDRIAIDRAIGGVKRPVAEDDVTLFFGDRAAAGRRAQAKIAVGQGFPGDLLGVLFGEQVRAAQQHPFRAQEETFADAADLMQRDVGGAGVHKRLADIPEILDLSTKWVLAVDIHFAHRDRVALRRPGLAAIVRVFEDIVTERIHPAAYAAREPLAGFRWDFAHVVGVVVVENVDAAGAGFQHHRVRCLRPAGLLDVDRGRPGSPHVQAAHGSHDLAGRSLFPDTGGDTAQPGAVIRLDDVRLVAVGDGRNFQTGDDVSAIIL